MWKGIREWGGGGKGVERGGRRIERGRSGWGKGISERLREGGGVREWGGKKVEGLGQDRKVLLLLFTFMQTEHSIILVLLPISFLFC